MKKVFVTGANSFLGTNLIIELINHNYKVKGLVRNLKSYQGITHQNLELIQGDLSDNLTLYLRGCDYVIHAASQSSQNLCQYTEYYITNVEGTIALAQASIKQNVEKLVYVSTANTVGYGDLNSPGIEKQPIKDPYLEIHYSRSKLAAENYLHNQTDKLKIVIVNPTFMLGSYDSKPTSGRIILLCLTKKLIPIPPGGRNFVHVRDVAIGIIRCLEDGKNGEKYLLAGSNLSYYQFFKKVIEKSNRNPVIVKIPKLIWIVLGYLGDLLRELKVGTILSSPGMKIICTNTFYSNEKSINELKLNYHSINDAITEALAYFTENNH